MENQDVVVVGDSPVALPQVSPEALLEWLGDRQKWEDRFCDLMTRNPLEALGALLLGGSFLFYLAELNRNPKVKTFWDALYYITTCASVGYADIFAATPAGKAISSVVFTFGPALCAKVFDRSSNADQAAAAGGSQAVLDRLDAILAELRKTNGGGEVVAAQP